MASRQAARRLGVPLVRAGFPVFDRIGMQHRLWAGYEGTRNLLLEVANTVLADHHEPTAGEGEIDCSSNPVATFETHLPELLLQGTHQRHSNLMRPRILQQLGHMEEARLKVCRQLTQLTPTVTCAE